MMYVESIRFHPVGFPTHKPIKCSGCGKRLKRQRRFQPTLNPYIRVDGIFRPTAEQIFAGGAR